MNKKCLLLKSVFLINFFALIFPGCRIEFDAKSVVQPDGSIERTVVYKAQEASDKEELINKYELPQGGKWTDSPLNVFSFVRKDPSEVMISSYEMKQTIPAGTQASSDFKRFGNTKEKFAGNQFSVEVKNKWLGKEYIYREKYTDIIDVDKIKSAANQILDQGLIAFEQQLSQRFEDKELVKGVVGLVKLEYTDLLFKYYQAVSGGPVNFEEVHKLADDLGKIFTPEYTSDLFAKKFPGLDQPEKRVLIAESFHATEKDLNAFLEGKSELKEASDEIFGAHGFTLFHYYDFRLHLEMPGKVVETNGERIAGGAVEWIFNSEKLNQDFFAKSKVTDYSPFMVLLGAAMAAVIVLLILLAPKKKKKKK